MDYSSYSSEKTKSCHATVQYHFEPPKALWNTEPVGFEDKRNKIVDTTAVVRGVGGEGG